MKGPFQISEIDKYVGNGVKGTYILSHGGDVAHYVGRSDSDLRSRLKEHVSEIPPYKHFWFEPVSSSLEAYYLECKWFHKYSPTDNADRHPAVPLGATWNCPVVGCPHST